MLYTSVYIFYLALLSLCKDLLLSCATRNLEIKERGISQCRYAIFPHARCRLFESFHWASNSRLQWSHETSCSSHFSPAAWSWRIWPQCCNLCQVNKHRNVSKAFTLERCWQWVGTIWSLDWDIGTTRKRKKTEHHWHDAINTTPINA